MDNDIPRKALAEFVGTFGLVFAVVTSLMVADGVAGVFGVAFTQGLMLALMVSALGHVSGAHFNPAVTLGFLLTRRISGPLAVVYWVVQLAAAVAAVFVARELYPDALDIGGNSLPLSSEAAVPVLGSGVEVWQGLLLEALLTFFLVWVVFATAVDPRGTFPAVAGFGIGLTVAVDILIAGPLTGAAMNPARAFGPQLVEWKWDDAWLYYVGPLLGGAIAALLYTTFFLDEREDRAEPPPEPPASEEAIV